MPNGEEKARLKYLQKKREIQKDGDFLIFKCSLKIKNENIKAKIDLLTETQNKERRRGT